jgi:hypothetical protein
MAKIIPTLVSLVLRGGKVVPVNVGAKACGHLPRKPVIRSNIK